MTHPRGLIAATLLSAFFAVISACGSDAETLSVASKTECIAEVAQRLVDCNEETSCEEGVSRFAGYCYNTAAGSQMDICRGGMYFFERPLRELEERKPELVAALNRRQRSIVIETGERYCVYNTN